MNLNPEYYTQLSSECQPAIPFDEATEQFFAAALMYGRLEMLCGNEADFITSDFIVAIPQRLGITETGEVGCFPDFKNIDPKLPARFEAFLEETSGNFNNVVKLLGARKTTPAYSMHFNKNGELVPSGPLIIRYTVGRIRTIDKEIIRDLTDSEVDAILDKTLQQ